MKPKGCPFGYALTQELIDSMEKREFLSREGRSGPSDANVRSRSKKQVSKGSQNASAPDCLGAEIPDAFLYPSPSKPGG